MKCTAGLVFLAAFAAISAVPVNRNGMVFYQPDYYNAHRAFVMQYASQPIKAYRRNGPAAGVTAYVSGKKVSAGTYLKRMEMFTFLCHWHFFDCHWHCFDLIEAELVEDEEDQPLDGAVQSVAEAYPAPDKNDDDQNEEEVEEEQAFVANRPVAADVPEDVPEAPVAPFVPNKNKKTPIQHDEEAEDDEEEEDLPVRTRNRPQAGATYFPVTFGSTNGGAIAIANSYSTGKGENSFKFPFNSVF